MVPGRKENNKHDSAFLPRTPVGLMLLPLAAGSANCPPRCPPSGGQACAAAHSSTPAHVRLAQNGAAAPPLVLGWGEERAAA